MPTVARASLNNSELIIQVLTFPEYFTTKITIIISFKAIIKKSF